MRHTETAAHTRKAISGWLHLIRRTRGLTQEGMADECNIPLSTYCKAERRVSRAMMSADVLLRIIYEADCTPQEVSMLLDLHAKEMRLFEREKAASQQGDQP